MFEHEYHFWYFPSNSADRNFVNVAGELHTHFGRASFCECCRAHVFLQSKSTRIFVKVAEHDLCEGCRARAHVFLLVIFIRDDVFIFFCAKHIRILIFPLSNNAVICDSIVLACQDLKKSQISLSVPT